MKTSGSINNTGPQNIIASFENDAGNAYVKLNDFINRYSDLSSSDQLRMSSELQDETIITDSLALLVHMPRVVTGQEEKDESLFKTEAFKKYTFEDLTALINKIEKAPTIFEKIFGLKKAADKTTEVK